MPLSFKSSLLAAALGSQMLALPISMPLSFRSSILEPALSLQVLVLLAFTLPSFKSSIFQAALSSMMMTLATSVHGCQNHAVFVFKSLRSCTKTALVIK